MDLTFYQILCLLSVPAIISSCGKYLIKFVRGEINDDKNMQLGLQALLRAQMITDYNKALEKGYAPIYAKENFENCWKRYHNLGLNGVMDDLHEKYLDFPTEPPTN